MKNPMLFLLIGSLFMIECSKSKHSTPVLTFNDSAYIKIIAENDFDSLLVRTQPYTLFPLNSFDKEKLINRKGIYKLGYKILKPEMIEISIVDTFLTYIVPGDTIAIILGTDRGSSINYRIDDPIHDYLKDEQKTFGNIYINSPIINQAFQTMPTTDKDFQVMCQKIDSAQVERLAFVDKYQNRLPIWFLNIQKYDIIYFSERLKFFQYFYLQNKTLMQNDIINEPPTMDITIYNPEALFSNFYYLFLESYFLMSCKIDYNRTGISRPLALYNSSSKYFNSILKDDVLKYFRMYLLLNLNRSCESKSDYDSVSQFMLIHDFGFNESELSFVNYERSRKQKEIDQKSNLYNGEKATAFALKDTSGKINVLSQFQNKIVYLHFWATWCKPCIAEIPSINELYERIGDNPIVIINICIDNQTEKWKQIIKKENLKGINLICQGNWKDILEKGYSITALPHYSLVNEKGLLIEYSSKPPTGIYDEIMNHLNHK